MITRLLDRLSTRMTESNRRWVDSLTCGTCTHNPYTCTCLPTTITGPDATVHTLDTRADEQALLAAQAA